MPHYSFLDGPYRLAMGLHTLEPGAWLEPGADAAQQMAERAGCWPSTRPRSWPPCPRACLASMSCSRWSLRHLPQHFPDRWQRTGAALVDRLSGERFRAIPPRRS